MRRSYCSGHVILLRPSMISKKCACGRPPLLELHNIHVCTNLFEDILFINMCLSSSSFALKTRSIRSGRSYGVCSGYDSRVISSHFELHVIVRKISGFLNLRTSAMASKYQRLMSLGPLINDEGIIVHFPTASDLPHRQAGYQPILGRGQP